MKTILVPTDFSKVSRNAVNYAAELAKLTKAKLVLINVYHIPIVTGEVPVVMPVWEDLEKDCMDGLKKIERSLRRKYSTLKIECVAQMGFALDVIINEYNKEKKPDLIVMGIHGAGYLSEKLVGSNTTSLIKRSRCPVLVIGEKARFNGVKNIVLAYDYKKVPDKSILELLKTFVKLFKSQLYVINVVKDLKKLPTVKEAARGVNLEQLLEGIKHSFLFVENKDTIEGINEFIKSKNTDWVVVIPRKHNILDAILHESNTKRMAFHTTIPLLALHE